MASWNVIKSVWERLFPAKCQHEFHLADLNLTGIPEPQMPRPLASREDWERWGNEVICGQHPWHTERVSWCCRLCGEEFRAHCGLDILQHGKVVG